MISIWTLTGLFILHYLADWRLQTDWMAVNKSKWFTEIEPGEGCTALLSHTGLYSLVFGNFFGWKFALITFILHTITDAITSQFTTKYFFFKETRGAWIPIWANRSPFFNTIGIDQLIHYVTLIWTLRILNG